MFIRKAERKQSKLRLALCGVAGSGKTTGSILLAKGLGGKFVMIDTERKSADLFTHLGDFDVVDLEPPFSPEKYMQAIDMCEKAGYQTIIIDSLSHAWAGEGGLLDIQDTKAKASSSKNSYFAWKEVTPLYNKLVDKMLQSNCHVIATMRSKTQYEICEQNGKKVPVKIGLSPIQREGIDYEFTVVLDIDNKSKLYTCSKDRTNLFDGKNEIITEETGRNLIKWLNSGKSFEEELNDVFTFHIDKIKNSKTIQELKENFESAYNDKMMVNNNKISFIVEEKDKIKASLNHLKAAS